MENTWDASHCKVCVNNKQVLSDNELEVANLKEWRNISKSELLFFIDETQWLHYAKNE